MTLKRTAVASSPIRVAMFFSTLAYSAALSGCGQPEPENNENVVTADTTSVAWRRTPPCWRERRCFEQRDFGHREEPDLGVRETPDLRTREEPDLRQREEPDLAVREIPDLAMREPPDLRAHESPDLATPPAANTIPATLFGLHIHNADTTTAWPTASFGAWRLWDSHTAWPQIEPSKGTWSFTTLDKDVDLATSHNVEPLLVLALTPQWASARPSESSAYGPGEAAEPANIADWTTYVSTVATRYKGRIKTYEIWNEPDNKSFFTGTTATMVTLAKAAYQTLKAIDPTITVVSPSQTNDYHGTWLDGFLTQGGVPYVDVIGYHFYYWPNPPEGKVQFIKAVQGVMAKHGLSNLELWDTESGWYIADQNSSVSAPSGNRVLSLTEATGDVARDFLIEWSVGVSRYYHYSWDGPSMALTEANGVTVKTPGIAYGIMENWIVGAGFEGCTTDSNDTWTCKISRAAGYTGYVVWNPNGNESYAIPAGVTTEKTLSNTSESVSGQSTVQIGTIPILLD